ncbi:MAG: dipeptide epimerase [Melioribacteraceae bacterium]|nr:dipeptide epimerase [Melioribacteraceae bacterium]MCF8354986.1 dipeptide epimerase [Melioribacteraceae bacterium]MCF8394311.1 dipeptide epimerase [Melioribacteraceae bacterium]MCF8419990.1 dipeptide epimerase [Melioribacteraceae bacterium]
MKITSVEIIPVEMNLKEPYTIAYETVGKAHNIFIKLSTNEKITGFGCAAPDFPVTNETPETVIEFTKSVIEPMIIGVDPLRFMLHHEKIRNFIAGNSSAVAMLDMAMFDILGKKAQIPLYKILGGFRDRMKTSVTIGILPVEETLARADEFIADGFKILKIKGGLNVDHDIERMIKLREKIGKQILLRFDANQGYTVEQSIKFVEKTRNVKIEILEQPTPKGEPDLLGRVTGSVHIPVMADESLMNLRDAFRLARKELVDTVNVKLMKVGGINEALQINAVAKSAGLEVMVGCMDESALAISAGLHYALARPNVEYADLDGHLDLIGDPANGAVILKDGTLYPTNNPGLGFDPNL